MKSNVRLKLWFWLFGGICHRFINQGCISHEGDRCKNIKPTQDRSCNWDTAPPLPHHIPRTLKRAVFNAIFGMYVITTIILFLVKFDHYQRDSVFLKQKQQQKTTSWESVTMGLPLTQIWGLNLYCLCGLGNQVQKWCFLGDPILQ